jgi:hypothetical protein
LEGTKMLSFQNLFAADDVQADSNDRLGLASLCKVPLNSLAQKSLFRAV